MRNIVLLNSQKNISTVHQKKGNKTGIKIVRFLLRMIIIGILSLFALGEVLRHVINEDVKRSKGKYAVGYINRVQQAYYFKNGTFSSDLTGAQLQTTNVLGIIIDESEYYNFAVETTPTVAYALAIPKNPDKKGIRGYSGAVFFDEEKENYQSIICQTNEMIEKPSKSILRDRILTCSEGMTEVK